MRSLPIAVGLCVVLAVPAEAQVARPVEGVTIELPCDDGTGEMCGSVAATRNMADNRITVLASGQWLRLDESAQAVSVLDWTDLQAVQGPDMARALQRLPSVTLTRNGGLGSFTGLSVRGSASERVLVLVDGVRMNDVGGPAGGFDFGSVVSGGVERVELLRGPGSLVWGSDALGGVVHLTSRIANGLEASGEAGGAGQLAGNVALGGYLSGLNKAGISASYVTRSGFSSAATGVEDDGFEQLALSARGEGDIGPFTLFGSARYAAGESEIDGFPAPDYTLADTAERQEMRQLSARVGVEYGTRLTLSLGHGSTRRASVDAAFSPDPYYSNTSRATQVQARGRVDLTDEVALIGGGDWEWSRFADGYTAAQTDIGSTHAMVAYVPQQSMTAGDLSASAGLRIDRHREFGTALTFAANGFVLLSEQLRLRAAYGEGFKAPSLFQLHSDYGNLALDPESSRSFEAGVELWPTWQGERIAALTLFRSDSRDLIDFISCPPAGTGFCANRPYGTYDNIGRARSQGVEVEGSVQLAAGLQAGLAYAFTTSTNRETGLGLARRPRHAGTMTLDWQAAEAVTLGADLRVVSASFDDSANTVPLGGHALLDLRASWAASEHFELYGRIENAWDEHYQTAAGYATQGRAAYVGVRAKL